MATHGAIHSRNFFPKGFTSAFQTFSICSDAIQSGWLWKWAPKERREHIHNIRVHGHEFEVRHIWNANLFYLRSGEGVRARVFAFYARRLYELQPSGEQCLCSREKLAADKTQFGLPARERWERGAPIIPQRWIGGWKERKMHSGSLQLATRSCPWWCGGKFCGTIAAIEKQTRVVLLIESFFGREKLKLLRRNIW
jgi:hypothetical protein